MVAEATAENAIESEATPAEEPAVVESQEATSEATPAAVSDDAPQSVEDTAGAVQEQQTQRHRTAAELEQALQGKSLADALHERLISPAEADTVTRSRADRAALQEQIRAEREERQRIVTEAKPSHLKAIADLAEEMYTSSIPDEADRRAVIEAKAEKLWQNMESVWEPVAVKPIVDHLYGVLNLPQLSTHVQVTADELADMEPTELIRTAVNAAVRRGMELGATGQIKAALDEAETKHKEQLEKLTEDHKAELNELRAHYGVVPELGGGEPMSGAPIFYSNMSPEQKAGLSPADRDRLVAAEVAAKSRR